MTFETDQDIIREKKAIERFIKIFDGSFKKLDPSDVDYKVFDKDATLIAYVEVKGRIKTIREAYPLPISVRKLIKLIDKRLNPVIIWACEDGIIYGRADKLVGQVKWGGRAPREGSSNDAELMAYYDKQKEFKYVRYL